MPSNQVESSLAGRLKQATAWQHQESEAAMVPMLGQLRNREDYSKLLAVLYSFYAPLELRIQEQIDESAFPDLADRGKALKALQDLHAMGFNNIPSHTEKLPKVDSAARALGAMYVLEGSTLGGRMITRMLKDNSSLQLQDQHLNFFEGYRDQTGPKWKSFVQILNEFEGNEQELIQAANDTFETFGQWLKQHHHHEAS